MNLEFDRHGAFARAAAFAAYAHDGQTRKGSALPYLVHPMEAAAIAATMTNDPDVLAAAVLHDVVEDCGVEEAELRTRFGRRVARLVMAESEQKEADARASWQKRKLRAVNRLRAAPREDDPRARRQAEQPARNGARPARARAAAVASVQPDQPVDAAVVLRLGRRGT